MPFQNQFRLKIRKSKRHTEHYSRLTQNPVQTERAPTIHYTPNLYTEHVIINSNVLLFLELKTTFEESVTTSGLFLKAFFFSPLSFCFHYCWGRERRKRCLLTDLRFVFNLQGKKTSRAKTNPSHLLLSRYISSSPLLSKCSSISNFHRSSCSRWQNEKQLSQYSLQGEIHPLMLLHHHY